jgi:pyruvoyl-dependent arginine decarboxylase (PvlArgDC)
MQEDFSSIQDNGSSGRVPLNGDRHRSSFDFESSSLNGDSLSSSTNRKEHRFCSLPFLISFISLSISIYLIFSRSVSPIPPTSISPSPSSSGLTARRIFGPRIPRHYFFTSGVGRSNVGIETGSFDDALFNASIADMNIMKYTSVLPHESSKILRSDASLHHGAVLECIMAQANGGLGDVLTAGILTKRIRRKSDGLEIGGYVVEYPSSDAGVPRTTGSGINVTETEALINLQGAMEQLLTRRFGANYGDAYELYDHWHYIESMRVTDSIFGSVIVALGFTDWIYPEDVTQRIDYRVKYGRFQHDL